MMRKIITYCFDKWWRPILFGSLTIVFFAISEIIKNSFIASLGFTFFVIGLFYMLISTYYQLSQKRWVKSILTFLMFCGTIVVFIFYSLLFWINQEPSYSWTDQLEISSNIKPDQHIDMEFAQFKPETLTNSIVTSSYPQLNSPSQTGFLNYESWKNKVDSNINYLTVIGINHNYLISSDDSLSYYPSFITFNSSDSSKRFGSSLHLTIIEDN